MNKILAICMRSIAMDMRATLITVICLFMRPSTATPITVTVSISIHTKGATLTHMENAHHPIK